MQREMNVKYLLKEKKRDERKGRLFERETIKRNAEKELEEQGILSKTWTEQEPGKIRWSRGIEGKCLSLSLFPSCWFCYFIPFSFLFGSTTTFSPLSSGDDVNNRQGIEQILSSLIASSCLLHSSPRYSIEEEEGKDEKDEKSYSCSLPLSIKLLSMKKEM